jgi:S-methylmethionine-dependent homocysteine/selenocysteine methylase/predicted RNA methylase
MADEVAVHRGTTIGHRRRDGAPTDDRTTAAARVARLIADGTCVLLDGATATELPRVGATEILGGDDALWGTRALVDQPATVRDVHRRYVAAGCDVVTTDTWGLPSALRDDGPDLWSSSRPVHWMDIARRGVRVARDAIAAEDATGRCAVAFSLNADLDGPEAADTVELLSRAFADAPPDLLLFETLSLVRPSLFATVEALVDTGLDVWLSFRRCREGMCGVFGQHWGGPEGDTFGRAARRFAEMGVGALLVNCIPPDHVDGMVSYLRDFTDMPLGVYPNLGYLTDDGWYFDPGIDGAAYAELALRWREEGAQIIGGCCGVGPEHIAAARERLEGTAAGSVVRASPFARDPDAVAEQVGWTDRRGRQLYPLQFPDLIVDEGVFAPTEGSLLVWRHLFDQGIGAGQRCLDVGCGAGLQGIQLALNGASHVHAIDLDPRAVDNTMTNAFRNGVADRMTAATIDLYPWVPDVRYDVIVASLYQTPVDPFGQLTSHRPFDYWGRNAVDHMLGRLPDALAVDGVAYVLHLSILSQRRTMELLADLGLSCEVAGYEFFPITEHFAQAMPQIDKVVAQSDAHLLDIGGSRSIVAYLLAVRHAEHAGPSGNASARMTTSNSTRDREGTGGGGGCLAVRPES